MLITLPIILISALYSLIFIVIGRFIKSNEIYTKSAKSLKSLKEYAKKRAITVGQMRELMADYKAIFKKQAELYIISLGLFIVFYHFLIPVFIGNGYGVSFLILSIIFSILISLCLFVFRKFTKKKTTDIKV